jgi:mono/diheme cytochrome c family protein
MKSKLFLLLSLLCAAGLIAACGAGAPAPTPTPRGNAAAGKDKFEATCSACHGPDAKGKPGLGKDLTTSAFAKGKTDDELVAFVTHGRDPSDPLNTTGVAMPPRGGNPALQDNDLYDIVAFIRTLEQ